MEKLLFRYWKQVQLALLVILGMLAAWLWAQTAWVGDDAFISFRTIDNFVNGHGLRWNVHERVQSFTHPLWVFLLIPFHAMVDDLYFTSLVISGFLFLVTLVLLYLHTPEKTTFFPVLLAILGSSAFLDYTSSGLENPLSYALFGLFIWLFFQEKWTLKHFLKLVLLGALIALNRLDLTLIVAPAVLGYGVLLWKDHGEKPGKTLLFLLLGGIPLLTWEVFSVIYYGFPFPNTYYAKIQPEIGTWELMVQGMRYYADALLRDGISLGIIGLGLGFAAFSRSRKQHLVALGVVFYLLYILKIGGGFMAGRFLSVPILVAAFLLALRPLKPKIMLVWMLLAIGMAFVTPHPTFLNGPEYSETTLRRNGIADERGFYFKGMGMIPTLQAGRDRPQPKFGLDADSLRQSGNEAVLTGGSIGTRGFYAGPKITLIDHYGLCDPLLARSNELFLPWRIGHFMHPIPKGYIETLETGSNQFTDPKLGAYYEELSLITQGPIWSGKRWKAIWAFSFGRKKRFTPDT